MIDLTVKPGATVWWHEWDGVKSGTLLSVNDVGDLAIRLPDGKIQMGRTTITFLTEAEAWEGKAQLEFKTAHSNLTMGMRAIERAEECRKMQQAPEAVA